MPISFHVADAGIGLLYRLWGHNTAAEVLDLQRDVEPHLAGVRYILIDTSETETLAMDRAGIQQVAAGDVRLAARHPGIVVAVFCPSDIAFGMARMYETLSEQSSWRIRVFRDRDKAEAWLRSELAEAGGEALTFS